ncbi:MAG: type II toxin-antitoxin system HicA family toxin [Chloroflexi bacterium]|nr:type II toxin-antitoxin system HicA family toxin [Chloroflexota bacterium]
MKLPRDVGGDELARRLKKYGYQVTRQTGSHMRLTSSLKGTEHHVTVPKHGPLRVGTFSGVVKEVAVYLEMDSSALIAELFRSRGK